MIKNLLYSLFIHSLLLLVIYASFNLKKSDDNQTREITVSIMPFAGSEEKTAAKPQEPQPPVEEKKPEEKIVEKPVEKKAPVKEKKAPKVSPKNEVKKEAKKLEKPKEKAVTKNTPIESKIPEIKKEEKIVEKEKPVEKKEDPVKKEGKEKKEDEITKKEKDLGAKEKAETKEEIVSNKKAIITEPTPEDLASSVDNLDLSAREKFNIQSQLRRCYRRALDETKMKGGIKIAVKAKINESGYIDSDIDELLDIKRYNDPSETGYKIAIDNARRAITLCSPLRNLPLDKYDVWKEVLLQFDEEN